MTPLVSILGTLSLDGSMKFSEGSLVALFLGGCVTVPEHQHLKMLDVEEKLP
jgi:hypothetical protein